MPSPKVIGFEDRLFAVTFTLILRSAESGSVLKFSPVGPHSSHGEGDEKRRCKVQIHNMPDVFFRNNAANFPPVVREAGYPVGIVGTPSKPCAGEPVVVAFVVTIVADEDIFGTALPDRFHGEMTPKFHVWPHEEYEIVPALVR